MPEDNGIPVSQRFPEIDPARFTPAQAAAAAALIATPRGAVRGPFVPLIRSPQLLDHTQSLGEYLRYRCSVPVRLREFAILVTARHWNQAYEWAAHVGPAMAAGVSPATLSALAQARALDVATADEKLIHSFVTAVHTGGTVPHVLFDRTRKLLGEQGLVDLLGLCGYYAMLAMVLNVAEIEAGASAFSIPA